MEGRKLGGGREEIYEGVGMRKGRKGWRVKNGGGREARRDEER